MNLPKYGPIAWKRKKYLIISLVVIFTLVLFTDVLKQKDWLEMDIDKQLLTKVSLRFVPSFLRKTERKTNTNRRTSKRRICILNVDTRPIERFADVKDITKMQYYSIAAYS